MLTELPETIYAESALKPHCGNKWQRRLRAVKKQIDSWAMIAQIDKEIAAARELLYANCE